MAIFDFLISAEIKDGYVRITNVNYKRICFYIKKIQGDSRFVSQVLEPINRGLKFREFFLPDFFYILEKIHDSRVALPYKYTIEKILTRLQENTWIKDIDNSSRGEVDFNRLKDLTYTSKDYQLEFFNYYNNKVHQLKLKGALLSATPGSGKAQPLSAKIKVPDGWSTMGNMQVGSQIIARDGTIANVIGIYPQGLKDIYRITFADGRKTEATLDHLWKVYFRGWKDGHRIITTEELIKFKGLSYTSDRLYIDLCDSEQNTDIELPIDPYILGVLLGDGSISTPSIGVCNPDEFILNKIKDRLPEDLCVSIRKTLEERCLSYGIKSKDNKSNDILNYLKQCNLLGTRSFNKFIPEIYLNGSIQQRLTLLQGLMDTDGTVDKQGTVSFCSTSKELAIGVQYLVRSLGGIASISLRVPSFTYKEEKKKGRLAYQVNIRYKTPEDLFTLPKKNERCNNDNQYSSTLKLRVENIEHIGLRRAQCIAIDHPEHLYITDDFVVTHNTYSTLALAHCLNAEKIIVVCPLPAIKTVWESQINEVFKNPPSYWLSVSGKEYNNEKIVVVHYEQLQYVNNIVDKLVSNKTVVIIDESHNFNNIRSLRTELLLNFINQVNSQDIIFASGTAVKALGSELVVLFKAIDPLFVDDVQRRFTKLFGDKSSESNIELLRARLGNVSFKVEKAAINLNAPNLIQLPISFGHSERFLLTTVSTLMKEYIEERTLYYASHYKDNLKFYNDCIDFYAETIKLDYQKLQELDQYKLAIEDIIRAYKSNNLGQYAEQMKFCNIVENKSIIPNLLIEDRTRFKDVKTLIKYASLKIQGEALGRVLGKLRTECISEIAKHINYASIIDEAEKKTVIFSSYIETCDIVIDKLKSSGYKTASVYGQYTKQLTSTVKQFMTDPEVNPLVATFASLSTAVPLIAANTMIMVNEPFRSYMQEQAISRIHRLNQDSAVFVYEAYLDTDSEPNLSTRGLDILKWSQQQVEQIMGTKSIFDDSGIDSDTLGINIANESYDIYIREVFENKKIKHALESW